MHTTVLNPFVAGGAIGDPGGQGFFGRAKVFGFVRSALNSVQRSPILLIGQRRIGKSSVLRQLPNHLPPEYCCIYFDLQGKDLMRLDDVLYGLARAISDGVKMGRPDRAQATELTTDPLPDFGAEPGPDIGTRPGTGRRRCGNCSPKETET